MFTRRSFLWSSTAALVASQVPASIGSLAATSILETPCMVNVLPAPLMANNQAKSFKEASRYLPLSGFQEQQGSEVLRPQTRGMQGANMQNSRMDGMGIVITGANSMEMRRRCRPAA